MFSMVKFYRNAADIATGYKAEMEFLAEFDIHHSRESHKKNTAPLFFRTYEKMIQNILASDEQNKKIQKKHKVESGKQLPSGTSIDIIIDCKQLKPMNDLFVELAEMKKMTKIPQIEKVSGPVIYYRHTPDCRELQKETKVILNP